jgi:putative transposase
MLEPVQTLLEIPAETSVEEGIQSKPIRKRAKKPRVGLVKGMRVQIKPTPEQAMKLAQWAATSRWLWNWALAKQHAYYAQHQKSLGSAEISRELTQLMRDDPELSWLRVPPRTCHTQTLNNLAAGWQNFFDGVEGKRPDKPGQPVFHCKGKKKDSVGFQVDHRHKSPINIQAKNLRVPGLGRVEALFTEPLNPEGCVGLDGSVVHGAVASSDGVSTYVLMSEADRARDDTKRANKKRYQRKQSRLVDCRLREAGLDPKKPIPKGTRLPKSNRQKKLDLKVAGCELDILFARNDRIHKFTTDLVRNHHTIVVETLMLHAMAQSLSRGFRRRMHEACMGEILRQLKYKCAWYDRRLIFVDKWFPSSKRCSNTACHQKNTQLKLRERAWMCPHCLTEHARDDNAAFNLWQEGWRLLRQPPQSCPTVVSTVAARGKCCPIRCRVL